MVPNNVLMMYAMVVFAAMVWLWSKQRPAVVHVTLNVYANGRGQGRRIQKAQTARRVLLRGRTNKTGMRAHLFDLDDDSPVGDLLSLGPEFPVEVTIEVVEVTDDD